MTLTEKELQEIRKKGLEKEAKFTFQIIRLSIFGITVIIFIWILILIIQVIFKGLITIEGSLDFF